VTFAGLESSTKSLRLKSAARAAALAGKRHPGARNYGYTSTGSAIVPEEAAAIREAATRVLRGETLRSIARDFNTRGIRRARGGLWVGNSLRGILEHPSLAGLRSYEGEIVAKGSWPAILDEATSARLRLLFADPTRRHFSDQPTSHLLRGFMRCGRCGGRLKPCQEGHHRRKGYTCYPKPDGCGRIYIRCDGVDELVATTALDRIAEVRRRAIHGHRNGEAPKAAVAETLERHRVDLLRAARDYYVEHAIGHPQFLAVRDELDRVLGQERQELLSPLTWEMLTRLGTKAPQEAWDSFDLAQRREMLGAVLDHVVVHPAPRDSRFHAERVEIFWFGQGSLRPSATRAVPPPRRRRTDPDERLSTKQAADYLRVKDETVMRLIGWGDLVGQKGEHGWFVTLAAVNALLEERRLRPQRPRGRRPATTTPTGPAT
jgi:site-specific DNA recombinase